MPDHINLSPLTLATLCQLFVKPQSGYDLKKTFEETPMGHFSSSPGAIYPAIKRMEKSGWIIGSKANADTMRPSKLLSITESGLEILKSYFESPVKREHVIHDLDKLMLRFAFTTPLLGRPATIRFLEQFISALAAYVEELTVTSKQYENDPLEGRLALKQGLDSYIAQLEWARQSLLELSGAS